MNAETSDKYSGCILTFSEAAAFPMRPEVLGRKRPSGQNSDEMERKGARLGNFTSSSVTIMTPNGDIIMA